jgi:hypothetical protein
MYEEPDCEDQIGSWRFRNAVKWRVEDRVFVRLYKDEIPTTQG